MAQAQALNTPDKRELAVLAERVRYGRRQVSNRVFAALMFVLTMISVALLFIIVATIITHAIPVLFPQVDGLTTFNIAFFTQTPPGDLSSTEGGYAQAIVGSLEIVVVSALVAVPLGLGTAIYLAEYGYGRFAEGVRFVLGLMAGLPSIVIGIVVWAALVRFVFQAYNGWAGAIALMLIMIPIIAISVESILKLVPSTLREAGLALGMPRWRVILRIVLPTVGGGVTTGVMLALARALGETAPLLLTDLGNNFFNFDLTQPVGALPLQVYNDAIQAYPAANGKSWVGVLVLVLVVAVVSAAVRYVTRKSRYES